MEVGVWVEEIEDMSTTRSLVYQRQRKKMEWGQDDKREEEVCLLGLQFNLWSLNWKLECLAGPQVQAS